MSGLYGLVLGLDRHLLPQSPTPKRRGHDPRGHSFARHADRLCLHTVHTEMEMYEYHHKHRYKKSYLLKSLKFYKFEVLFCRINTGGPEVYVEKFVEARALMTNDAWRTHNRRGSWRRMRSRRAEGWWVPGLYCLVLGLDQILLPQCSAPKRRGHDPRGHCLARHADRLCLHTVLTTKKKKNNWLLEKFENSQLHQMTLADQCSCFKQIVWNQDKYPIQPKQQRTTV